MNTKGWYNGFPPAQRAGKLALVRAAVISGALPTAERCSVCQRKPIKPLGWHSERYDLIEAYPVCRRCHYAVHIRFARPRYWQAFIRSIDRDNWVQCLSLDPKSLTQDYRETYSDDLAVEA